MAHDLNKLYNQITNAYMNNITEKNCQDFLDGAINNKHNFLTRRTLDDLNTLSDVLRALEGVEEFKNYKEKYNVGIAYYDGAIRVVCLQDADNKVVNHAGAFYLKEVCKWDLDKTFEEQSCETKEVIFDVLTVNDLEVLTRNNYNSSRQKIL